MACALLISRKSTGGAGNDEIVHSVFGCAGTLDFSIDRVRAVHGEWIPLRYTLTKKSGESHATRTGVMTAAAAVVFWPAAPAFLLIRGKDITVNKGVIFDTFTDQDHVFGNTNSSQTASTAAVQKPNGGGSASVTVTSATSGADIEVDGAFVGSTPTTLSLASGTHHITVKSGAVPWQRDLQVSAGSNISVNAQAEQSQFASRRSR